MGWGKLSLLILFILVPVVTATTVTQNDITITSDKDTYFCEPIYNQAGECLIRSYITVTNGRTSAINLDGLSTYSNSVSNIEYVSSEGSRIPQHAQAAIPQELYLGGESKTYLLQFWAKENGKFNYTVNLFQLGTGNLIATTVLDPFYNITINASVPSYHLKDGVVLNDSLTEFENYTDITDGLKDGSSATNYQVYYASNPTLDNYLINAWSFNEYIFDEKVYSATGEADGQIYGALDTVVYSTEVGDYYGGYFDGVNDYVRFQAGEEFDLEDLANMTMCAVLNTTMQVGGDFGIITKGAGLDGIYMRYKSDETVDCEFDGFNGAVVVSSDPIDDGEPHLVCCVKTGDDIDLWQNGELIDSDSANIGYIQNSNPIYFGSLDLGYSRWQGVMRQVAFFNTSLNSTYLQSMNQSKSIFELDKGYAIQGYFNYSFIDNAVYYNYLALETEVNDLTTVRVMTYENTTHPNSSNYLTTRITSGTSYILLDDLIGTGYDAPFRFWGLQNRQDNLIDEMSLIVAINDTENPSITNCLVNTTSIGCDETVRLQCDVTDDGFIYQVWHTTNFTGTGTVTTEQANRINDIYYIDRTIVGGFNESKDLIFTVANATDLGGNINITYPNIYVNYTCSDCIENWIQDSNPCLTNDSYLISYTDANACGTNVSLPAVNGTYASCNYCSEDIVCIATTGCYLDVNGSAIQNFTCIDNDYYSCCAVTSIYSDCSILYTPYNGTVQEPCDYVNSDFSLEVDTLTQYGLNIFEFKENKVHGNIWLNDTNTTYSCISYVKTIQGDLVQTNPSYQAISSGLITFTQKEYDDREFFVTQNGLSNIYWTDHNIIVDGRDYLFGVECAGNGQVLRSEALVTVGYKQVNEPFTRAIWLRQNVIPLTVGMILLIIVIFTLYFIYRVSIR